MAMVKCKECGNQISKKAEKCPHCGVKRNKTSAGAWVVLIIIIVGALAVIGSNDNQSTAGQIGSQSENAAPPIYSMGKTVHVGYTSYKVFGAWYASKLDANPYTDQEPDGIYLVIKVAVRNDDNEQRMVPPFHLVDKRGNTYDTSVATALENELGPLTSLNPGVKTQGTIAFDVPDMDDYTLKISGGYWSDEVALVDINP